MTEVLFLVTTIFVAYVVYVIANEKKTGKDPAKSKPATASSTASQSVSIADKPKATTTKPKAKAPAPKTSEPKPTTEVKAAPTAKAVAEKPAAPAKKTAPKTAAIVKLAPEKPVAAKAAPKPAAPVKSPAKTVVQATPEAAPAASMTLKGSGLKDPKTGEVTTAYSNYRFTKRWIKEALVTEKFVDKVYKNEEINADIDSKIKAGLIQLENMKKYQP